MQDIPKRSASALALGLLACPAVAQGTLPKYTAQSAEEQSYIDAPVNWLAKIWPRRQV